MSIPNQLTFGTISISVMVAAGHSRPDCFHTHIPAAASVCLTHVVGDNPTWQGAIPVLHQKIGDFFTVSTTGLLLQASAWPPESLWSVSEWQLFADAAGQIFADVAGGSGGCYFEIDVVSYDIIMVTCMCILGFCRRRPPRPRCRGSSFFSQF